MIADLGAFFDDWSWKEKKNREGGAVHKEPTEGFVFPDSGRLSSD